MNALVCCATIPSVLTLGTTYTVVEWIIHKYGRDPVVVCDDGKSRLMWKGLFHD